MLDNCKVAYYMFKFIDFLSIVFYNTIVVALKQLFLNTFSVFLGCYAHIINLITKYSFHFFKLKRIAFLLRIMLLYYESAHSYMKIMALNFCFLFDTAERFININGFFKTVQQSYTF